jgi:hypothetical protein
MSLLCYVFVCLCSQKEAAEYLSSSTCPDYLVKVSALALCLCHDEHCDQSLVPMIQQ